MTTLKNIATGRSDLFRLNINDINVVDGFNVREHTPEYEAHIDALAQSISEVGVLEPLRGYMDNGNFYLTNGHSRLMAVKRANEVYGATIETVPVLPEAKYGNEADRVLTLLTSNSGRPLTALEVAAVYRRLYAFGWTEAEIAKKSGVSLACVMNKLEMAAMPEAAKELVREGKVSASFALETVKEGRLEKLEEAAKETGKKVTRQRLDGVERAKRGSKTGVREIIEAAFDTIEYDESGENVNLRLTSAQWRSMLRLLKL